MIIYTNQKSKKKPKNTKKKQELKASWDKLMEKWDVKPNKMVVAKSKTTGKNHSQNMVGNSYNWRDYVDPCRLTDDIPSVDTGVGLTPKKESPQYTGESMLGVGQLHKSNAIPIFKQEDAEDLAKMSI